MLRKYSALFLALVVITMVSCKKADQVVPGSGIINFVAGDVQIIEGDVKKAANAGDKIVSGMIIRTGAKSEAEIYFGENAIKILENTVFHVKDMVQNLTQNTERTELYVEKGKLYSTVKKKLTKDSSYLVRTPTAVAGVRGTDFIVSEENGRSNIACAEGRIAVNDASKPESTAVELNAGQEVDVVPGENLTPRDISDMNRRNLEEIRRQFREMKEDIRRQFEEQREEIRKAVIDQRELNRQSLEQQREMNRENLQNLKDENRANIDALKGDVNAQREASRQALEGVKPDVESFRSEADRPAVNEFKAKVEKPRLEKPSIK